MSGCALKTNWSTCCDHRVIMATKFDRESFNLLKMTDSGSESVPDHTFEISHQSRNKKKVRLKRWAKDRLVVFIEWKGYKYEAQKQIFRRERKARGSVGVSSKMGKLHEAWWCSTCPTPPGDQLEILTRKSSTVNPFFLQ